MGHWGVALTDQHAEYAGSADSIEWGAGTDSAHN